MSATRHRITATFSPANERIRREVFAAVRASANEICKDTQDSIKAGGVPSPNHVVSKPGEPPNADTHNLDRNVVVQEEEPQMRCRVLSRAPYAVNLEYGTSRMAPRPYLRPALARGEAAFVQRVAAAVRRATGGG